MEKVRQVIVFCDVRGFARAARGLGEQLPSFVQSFYEAVGAEIVRHGGTILKYIGDAVLAVFPAGREKRTIRAAVAMRRAFADVAERWNVDPACELAVGVHVGEVTRGAFGHASLRMDDIIGEEVSIASVLTAHVGVAISSPVREATIGAISTEPLPDIAVAWRSEPVRAWRVSQG